MTVRRLMGMETEYGIFCPSDPQADSAVLSGKIIHAYSRGAQVVGESGGVRWDYSGEQPLRDARGFEISREEADLSMLTDDPEAAAPSGPAGAGKDLSGTRRRPVQRKVIPTDVVRLTAQEMRFQRGNNTALCNGSRLYLDHSHPEYSAPETTSPRAAVIYDRAGELVMARAMATLESEGEAPINLYKNNVDGKGASYGTHENYLVPRSIDFEDLVAVLTPFFVTRPVICGSGRVGIGRASEQAGFQICQRADYVEQTVGLETTFNRPIINTRDEPHADPDRWRRLHVIGGDANCFSITTWLKLCTTSLLLWVVERQGVPAQWAALKLADPVSECAPVSHDLTLTHRLKLADGRELTALEIQQEYLEVVQAAVGTETDEETEEALALWAEILERLPERRAELTDCVEWVAKEALFTAMRARRGLDWGDAQMMAMDLQWSDMRPGRGLAAKLAAAGRVRPIGTAEEVATAEFHPPRDTRAYFRGELIRRWDEDVFAAAWHSIVVEAGREYLLRLPMTDFAEWTADHVAELLENSDSMVAVVDAVTDATRTPAGVRYGNLWY